LSAFACEVAIAIKLYVPVPPAIVEVNEPTAPEQVTPLFDNVNGGIVVVGEAVGVTVGVKVGVAVGVAVGVTVGVTVGGIQFTVTDAP
jgi:Na+/H+ antiporter NhaA